MNKELKKDISTYHHNIENYSYPNVTSHISIYNIFADIIINPEFTIQGDGVTLEQKCDHIKSIQSEMNIFSSEEEEYKTLKGDKSKVKQALGGCYYQIYKPTIKKGENNNSFTGFIVIDIDNYDESYTKMKEALKSIEEIVMFFTSPSGGLKIIVATDLKGTLLNMSDDDGNLIKNYDSRIYQHCYQSVIINFKVNYGIEIDYDPTARSNHNLICYYSYDPDAYFNANYIKYECYENAVLQFELDEKAKNAKLVKCNKVAPISKITGKFTEYEYSDAEVEELITKSLEGYYLEGFDDYDTWMKYNFALYSLVTDNYVMVAVELFGESEQEYIESFYRSASEGQNDITIASLIRYAKLAGYQARAYRSDEHSYANVIDKSREERLSLKKDGLTKRDVIQPAPDEVFPNYTVSIKTDRNGEETSEFKKRKSNDNVYALMAYLGIDLSFDIIKGMKIGVIPHYKTYKGSNDEEILHNDLEDIITINDFPKDKVNHLLRLHHSNGFNALTDMCQSSEWDGIDRIQQVKDSLKVMEGYEDWLDIALKKWLIQCVAAWDNARNTPNERARAAFDNVFILTGAQGINKSSFFEGLLPKELKDYFKGGVYLDPARPDSIRQATKFGLVELGEIDTTFSKSAISLLKAFLSNGHDLFREAYAKKDTCKERRTSYCGSVNGMQFLRDLTGNRRYYPVSIHDIDFDTYSAIDKKQLWAQIWQLYISGETWWLDKSSAEADLHKFILEQHMEADPLLDKLKANFDLTILNDAVNGKGYTSRDLLETIDNYHMDQATVRHLNRLLEGLGFISKRKNNSSNVWYLTSLIKGAELKKKYTGLVA